MSGTFSHFVYKSYRLERSRGQRWDLTDSWLRTGELTWKCWPIASFLRRLRLPSGCNPQSCAKGRRNGIGSCAGRCLAMWTCCVSARDRDTRHDPRTLSDSECRSLVSRCRILCCTVHRHRRHCHRSWCYGRRYSPTKHNRQGMCPQQLPIGVHRRMP